MMKYSNTKYIADKNISHLTVEMNLLSLSHVSDR